MQKCHGGKLPPVLHEQERCYSWSGVSNGERSGRQWDMGGTQCRAIFKTLVSTVSALRRHRRVLNKQHTVTFMSLFCAQHLLAFKNWTGPMLSTPGFTALLCFSWASLLSKLNTPHTSLLWSTLFPSPSVHQGPFPTLSPSWSFLAFSQVTAISPISESLMD